MYFDMDKVKSNEKANKNSNEELTVDNGLDFECASFNEYDQLDVSNEVKDSSLNERSEQFSDEINKLLENFQLSDTNLHTKIEKGNTLKELQVTDIVKELDDVERYRELQRNLQTYKAEIIKASEFKLTLRKLSFNYKDFQFRTHEEVQQKRKEFNSIKNKLIKEWEDLNGKNWPRYQNDIINNNGKSIRKAGDRYDAHHLQPLCLGGENESFNITPLDYYAHNEIHNKDSSFSAITRIISTI